MSRVLGTALIAMLVATSAAAQKVQIDYDKTVDYSKYRTFAWTDTPETSLEQVSPLMHSRIKNAIEHAIGEGGELRQVEPDQDPDLYVTYHTNSEAEVRYNTMNYGYGYGPGWYYGGGIGTSTTTAYTYEKGSLIVDLWDAETDTLVWRGIATATVKEDPEKNAKLINNMIDKMAKQWEKMYHGQ